MDYEWDADKSDKTQRERGFGFEIIEDFDWSWALCFEIQHHRDEERELWIGPIAEDLYAVVITERGQNTRIISLREATRPEIIQWREDIQNG